MAEAERLLIRRWATKTLSKIVIDGTFNKHVTLEKLHSIDVSNKDRVHYLETLLSLETKGGREPYRLRSLQVFTAAMELLEGLRVYDARAIVTRDFKDKFTCWYNAGFVTCGHCMWQISAWERASVPFYLDYGVRKFPDTEKTVYAQHARDPKQWPFEPSAAMMKLLQRIQKAATKRKPPASKASVDERSGLIYLPHTDLGLEGATGFASLKLVAAIKDNTDTVLLREMKTFVASLPLGIPWADGVDEAADLIILDPPSLTSLYGGESFFFLGVDGGWGYSNVTTTLVKALSAKEYEAHELSRRPFDTFQVAGHGFFAVALRRLQDENVEKSILVKTFPQPHLVRKYVQLNVAEITMMALHSVGEPAPTVAPLAPLATVLRIVAAASDAVVTSVVEYSVLAFVLEAVFLADELYGVCDHIYYLLYKYTDVLQLMNLGATPKLQS
ncbi:hypothetical protein SELMODRAFT_430525 [Selaginella moellendorffii]|uniref:Uncharacterized protein n=1 Tax=Selaginella moellendorffii TaxID=88036 RepID=D8T9P0_SELML|nr:hypothetical protein SELMODRAFT_430525 [Selaginella moellendorffii]